MKSPYFKITPSKAVTYGEWNGLFYVTTNFDNEASYIIGEGLNGGFSVCGLPGAGGLCEWTQNFFDLLVPQVKADVYTVTITASKYSVLVGEKIAIFINFLKNGILKFTQESSYTPTQAGIQKIASQIDPNASVTVVVKKEQLGDKYIGFDKDLIEIAKKYPLSGYPDGIPPDLLKSVIYQESLHKSDPEVGGQEVFNPKSYRYEAHKDYDWYSRLSLSTESFLGWRGFNKYPEKFFTISGKNLVGEIIPPGNQVPSDYLDWSINMGGGKLNLKTTQSNGHVLASEIYANNPNRRWYARSSFNFTAQLILAASYGLTQTLYEVAVNRKFDTRGGNGTEAVPIESLFDPSVSINLGAKHIAEIYTPAKDWWQTFYEYNGAYNDPDPKKYDSVDYADAVTNRWKNGQGDFKLILKNN
ncbi:MAG: hypothetical protein AAB595_00335 [Patescibacteria group bacterium]